MKFQSLQNRIKDGCKSQKIFQRRCHKQTTDFLPKNESKDFGDNNFRGILFSKYYTALSHHCIFFRGVVWILPELLLMEMKTDLESGARDVVDAMAMMTIWGLSVRPCKKGLNFFVLFNSFCKNNKVDGSFMEGCTIIALPYCVKQEFCFGSFGHERERAMVWG